MNKNKIKYISICLIILIFIVLLTIKYKNKGFKENFQKSKCYECENASCSFGYPTKCYDCQKQSKSSALNYVLGMPGGNPKMFTGM